MSKKRAAAELNPVYQQKKNAKRTRLATSSYATLKDLPIEMVRRILIRAVAMEVMEMKLAKSVRKEKADLVMSRLKAVCSEWNNILRTNDIRSEVHRILDQETIYQLEILHQLPSPFLVFDVTTLRDEIFMLTIPELPDGEWNGQNYVINVCAINNLAIQVKDVIRLPVHRLPWALTACSVSNCLYVLVVEDVSSVLRITKAEVKSKRRFKISKLITGLEFPFHILSVAANGNLLIPSKSRTSKGYVLSTYDVNGSLLQTVELSVDTFGSGMPQNVMQMPNGNVLLASVDDQSGTRLMEIDAGGSIVRRYESGADADSSFADVYGRIWITDWSKKIEVVDCELNLMYSDGPQLLDALSTDSSKVHYSSDTNEILHISFSRYSSQIITVLRFTEE